MRRARSLRSTAAFGAVVSACLAMAAPAFAHKASDAFVEVTVRGSRLDVRWEIAARDLDFAIGLDRDNNGAITWREVNVADVEIRGSALSTLVFRSNGVECPSHLVSRGTTTRSDGGYVAFVLEAECPSSVSNLAVDYGFLFDEDAQHRALVRVERDGERTEVVLDAARRTVSIETSALGRTRRLTDVARFVSGLVALGALAFAFGRARARVQES